MLFLSEEYIYIYIYILLLYIFSGTFCTGLSCQRLTLQTTTQIIYNFHRLLGAFTEVAKSAYRLRHACLSVRITKLGFHRTDE